MAERNDQESSREPKQLSASEQLRQAVEDLDSELQHWHETPDRWMSADVWDATQTLSGAVSRWQAEVGSLLAEDDPARLAVCGASFLIQSIQTGDLGDWDRWMRGELESPVVLHDLGTCGEVIGRAIGQPSDDALEGPDLQGSTSLPRDVPTR